MANPIMETDADVAALPTPGYRKDKWYRVKSPRGYGGLYVKCCYSGAKLWYYRFSYHTPGGRRVQQKYQIGPVADMDLAEAALAHREMVQRVKEEGDYIQQEADRVATVAVARIPRVTFRQAAQEWLDSVDRRLTPSTFKGYRQHLKHVLPLLGSSLCRDITVGEILAARKAVIEYRSTPLMAESCLARIRQVLNHALEQGYVTTNVAAAVRRHTHPKPRDRFYTDTELHAIWHGLEYVPVAVAR